MQRWLYAHYYCDASVDACDAKLAEIGNLGWEAIAIQECSRPDPKEPLGRRFLFVIWAKFPIE